MQSYIIKISQNNSTGKKQIADFLTNIAKLVDNQIFIFGASYNKGEFYFNVQCKDEFYTIFESNFYASFKDFQIIKDTRNTNIFDQNKTVFAEVTLQNGYFFPFKIDADDDTDFINNLFRSFDNLDIANDQIGYFVVLEHIDNEGLLFMIKNTRRRFWFEMWLMITFWKYLFSIKTQTNWKKQGRDYFDKKVFEKLYKTKIYIYCESIDSQTSISKIKDIFVNFRIFDNYPQNKFLLNLHDRTNLIWQSIDEILTVIGIKKKGGSQNIHNLSTKNGLYMTCNEVSQIFQFPKNPQPEGNLIKILSKKLPLPTGITNLQSEKLSNNEVLPIHIPKDSNVLGITDFRSTTLPIAISDNDRLKHMYIIGKTQTGKTKYLENLIINDINNGCTLAYITTDFDSFDKIITNLPSNRHDDVIIIDFADSANPISYKFFVNMSKESFVNVFAKNLSDGRNENTILLLGYIYDNLTPRQLMTLANVLRLLEDEQFRIEQLNYILDEKAKNFWENEYSQRSQTFKEQSLDPLLQNISLLLDDKNIKTLIENDSDKINFSDMNGKILLVKFDKDTINTNTMSFLGNTIIANIYDNKTSETDNFYIYIDEFQNFASENFVNNLSEFSKKHIGLCVAHESISQLSNKIIDLFIVNLSSLIVFQLSTEDANFMTKYFPGLTENDFVNLDSRECYIKLWQTDIAKEPFSARTVYIPDTNIDKKYIENIYNLSKTKYNI